MADPRESSEATIREFLTALASADAAHGAVSAAAVAGGLGTSLLQMVAALPMTRSDSAADRAALLAARTALSGVAEQLLEAIETETVVKIYAARKLPQTSATARAAREAKIQLALRAAADGPLEIMRLCAFGLQQAQMVAAHGSRAAATEVELAVALLRVSFAGARSNLEMRLTSLTDELYRTSILDEIARLGEESSQAARAAESAVQIPPA
jgi:formiminotetrahydrofolate cyclodeaminase